MDEYREVRQKTIQAVIENIPGQDEKAKEAAWKIADIVMDAIAENYRSISEVQAIVNAVRVGLKVQIAYAEPEEEENPYVVRACW